MNEQEKIQINKDEDLAEVSQKIFSSAADQITLIIPKYSKLSESAENFIFLKKGFKNTNKTLVVESVDDRVVDYAKKAGLSAQNPFFTKGPEPISLENPIEIEEPETKLISESIYEEVDKEIERTFQPAKKRRNIVKKKHFFSLLLLIILVGTGFWTSVKILPQAEISLTTHKVDWQFADKVIIDKNAVAADIKNLKIPGQIFINKKNGQFNFPASAKKNLSQKAKGKILIYNAFNSNPQPLVATTRFETPDGKIFRLDQSITVPGAKIVDGKIVPSFIEADAIADQPGEEYNLGSIAKLTIPGFKKFPAKFTGFYGEIRSPFNGGFVGERSYPNEMDIAHAKKESAAALQRSLKISLDSQVPQDFTVLKEASQFTLSQEKIDTNVNEKGEFSIFVDGELAVMGFRKKDLLAGIENKLQEDLGADYQLKSNKIALKIVQPDIQHNQLILTVNFAGTAEKPINANDLQRKIAGKSEAELKALIYGIPGLENAQISLWPFWVNIVPVNQEKIRINID